MDSKSISSASPARPSIEIVWSRPPVGAPTPAVSAAIAADTLVDPRATTSAQIRAAELDSPLPSGTSESTKTSAPRTPSSRSVAVTYDAQPTRSSTVPVQLPAWALSTLTTPSVLGVSATQVECASAIGRHSPAL
jgi:hypothetical protein